MPVAAGEMYVAQTPTCCPSLALDVADTLVDCRLVYFHPSPRS